MDVSLIIFSCKSRPQSMGPNSQSLFHFTKSVNALIGILKNGFWPRYSLENMTWLGDRAGNLTWAAIPIVCFCDIPLSRIADHVGFYGSYGIGMTRDWALRAQLNPIQYVAGENLFKNALLDLPEDINAKTRTKKDLRIMNCWLDMVAFTKPMKGTMVVDGNIVAKDFYSESEWRHVARHPSILGAMKANDDGSVPKEWEAENQNTFKHCCLKFTPADVQYLFVRDDNDIPPLIDFLSSSQYSGAFPHNDVKVLYSRVTSLETLHRDF